MTHPLGLDEYKEEDLAAEIARRKSLRDRGLCDYCGRDPILAACKMENRHKGVHKALVIEQPGNFR